jgi:hypothetical protein
VLSRSGGHLDAALVTKFRSDLAVMGSRALLTEEEYSEWPLVPGPMLLLLSTAGLSGPVVMGMLVRECDAAQDDVYVNGPRAQDVLCMMRMLRALCAHLSTNFGGWVRTRECAIALCDLVRAGEMVLAQGLMLVEMHAIFPAAEKDNCVDLLHAMSTIATTTIRRDVDALYDRAAAAAAVSAE